MRSVNDSLFERPVLNGILGLDIFDNIAEGALKPDHNQASAHKIFLWAGGKFWPKSAAKKIFFLGGGGGGG